MKLKNILLLGIAAGFLSMICMPCFAFPFFGNNNESQIQDAEVKTKYPDYSYEFVGKDKFENFNRKAFVFNVKLNKYVTHPISVAWASVMPAYGMERITDFYTNMNYPVRLISSLLQKDFESAGIETERVLINTTIGFVGFFDPAQDQFNITPRNEDVGQVLAHYNVKQGSYLVLPFTTPGNKRDIIGHFLNTPLKPTTYFGGGCVASTIGGNLSTVNDMVYMQPLLAIANNYADPYEASKQLNEINQYIKNNNLDRRNFINEAHISKNFTNINGYQNKDSLKADINLSKYNPQSRETDALRTMLFDKPQVEKSRWAELSIWNKSFNKQIKTASVRIDASKPKYQYRYVLQENKSAPVAILYPAIGEGIMSNQSAVITRLLYDEGYSVVVLGSSFNWAFAKSMPDDFRPGLPDRDAYYMRIVTANVLGQLQKKQDLIYNKKIVVGVSFGALTGLFVDKQESEKNTLGISKYICICPPIQIFYAMQQIDKFSNALNENSKDIKESTAINMEKVVQVSYNDYNKNPENSVVVLPFSEDESKAAISFAMRQKLYDLIFTLENGKVSKKNDIYENFSNMDFNTYVQKYIVAGQNKPIQQLSYDSSLYSLNNFLRENKNYKIYHSLDDCFTTTKDLSWLKKQTGEKTILFSNGSHLGFLYRKEFLNEFIKDTKIPGVI